MTPVYALLLVSLASTVVVAASLSNERFYVIRDMQNGFCEVTTKRPQAPGQTVLGDLAFSTMSLATARAQQICGANFRG
jgi:hypothetical protein